MNIYLVGGAIRDKLLGLPVTEHDWVVVGATPEELLNKGYKPVGKSFPVFLHPETHEEYALARTERKIGKGYKGFTFYAAPDVTLEQDLKRRDLTINAIAETPDGKRIDPYHGEEDLKKQQLRHVSEAFSEDPVRILRAARFSAKLPNFTIHPETTSLMKKMVDEGEVDALVPERVCAELLSALKMPAPIRFFETLDSCGAMKKLFPEFQLQKFRAPCINQQTNPLLRWSLLCHTLDNTAIESLHQRLRLPNEYGELATLTANSYTDYQHLQKNPKSLLNFLKKNDALRRHDRFDQLLECWKLCTGNQKNALLLSRCLNALTTIDTRELQEKNLEGSAFGKALAALQNKAILSILEKNEER